MTLGQQLALLQLRDIIQASSGALEVLDGPATAESDGFLSVTLSLQTKEFRTTGGLAFRDRERLVLRIPAGFPFDKPELEFAHNRFIGAPHVQWGHYVCLYQSPETEYVSADGMFGFFERVEQWMRAAGRGQLDPEDAPLHPPVAYVSSSTTFVARANTPANATVGGLWIGWADLRSVRADRFDVVGWTSIDDWGDANPDHPVAAAVFFDTPLASEFPTKVNDLMNLLEKAGLPFALLYKILRLFSLVGERGQPGYLILGAPMRRKAGGEPLRPHLTVWELEAQTLKTLREIVLASGDAQPAIENLAKWMVTAKVRWCRVLEDRAEIVNRRDEGTVLAWVCAKRVVLVGCGALGSAVAEMLVRSSVARLHLVDKAVVKPGILVRQRYSDSDIGMSKAEALMSRLQAIGLGVQLTAENTDLSRKCSAHLDPNAWDLLIDCTASVSVTHRIEEELKSEKLLVPLVSLSVSAGARNGSVMVKMPDYRGGPQQISRQAKLDAFAKHAGHPLVAAFWPERDKTELFQPEPGCSEPTFVGSSADVDYHAAGLLNLGLSRVQRLSSDRASMDLIAAPWLLAPESQHLGFTFEARQVQREVRHGYSVLCSRQAAADIAAELSRIARVRSDDVETGGLIFGEIDDAHQFIWVDSASGPPPDSTASQTQFLCGTAGTKELNEFKSKTSGNSSHFIGIWHTHPVSRGAPSDDDLNAMLRLLHFQQFPPRQVVMLIVGYSASTPRSSIYLYRRGEFRIIGIEELKEEPA